MFKVFHVHAGCSFHCRETGGAESCTWWASLTFATNFVTVCAVIPNHGCVNFTLVKGRALLASTNCAYHQFSSISLSHTHIHAHILFCDDLSHDTNE
jgi:hypothetical protein